MAEDGWDDWADGVVVAEDDYDYYDGFPGYVSTTNDPGPWMFVFSIGYSVLMILLIPCLMVSGRRWEKRRKEHLSLEEADPAPPGGAEGAEGGAETAATAAASPSTPEREAAGRRSLGDAPGHGIDQRGGGTTVRQVQMVDGMLDDGIAPSTPTRRTPTVVSESAPSNVSGMSRATGLSRGLKVVEGAFDKVSCCYFSP